MAGSKVLQIIETAYRATIEEQDDTVVWFSGMLATAGADVTVLLRGNAVNCAVRGQDASGLAFGEEEQTNPPDLAGDLKRLLDGGTEVRFVRDDAAERGLEGSDLIDGVQPVSRSDVPKLLDRFDHVWHW